MNWQPRHWANAVLIVSLAGLAGYALFLSALHAASSAFPQLDKKIVLTASQSGLDKYSAAGDSIGRFTWSPDSSMLAAFSQMGRLVTIWSIDGRPLGEFKRGTFSGRTDPIFLRGSKQLLTPPAGTEEDAHQAFGVWDVETSRMIRTVDAPPPDKAWRSSWPLGYAISPGAGTVAYISGHVNQPIDLYETQAWARKHIIPVDHNLAFSAAFSPDGGTLAIGTVDATIILAELRNPEAALVKFRVYEPPSSVFEQPISAGTASLAFSPDGRFLATGATSCSGRPVINAGSNEDEPISAAVAHAPVKVFRLADRKVVAAYPGHLAPIMRMSWTPDSRFLAIAAGDNTVRIFIPAQPELGGEVLKFDSPLIDASFSPDGRFLAAAAGKTLSIYEVKEAPDAR